MPSTFTSNTGIEKIADGEQTGLWGQTTNLNLDIIDRSLNGSTSISLSGTTHTLTTSNGLLSDGQFAVLLFAGSPSGTNTVTIAPNTAQKLYFVRNTTAETVILSQGSGATVSVLPGTSRVVFTDGAGAGAAVFDITNTLAMGSVAITGGSINGTTVGATSASTGAFTTLTSSGTTTLNGTTIPASKTLVDTDSSQTLTNKTISGANNTLSNIANASLTNSSITFGSTAQALGSTVSALNGVTIGATTASTGAFTTLSASTSLTTPLVTNAGTLALSATGANIVTASTNGVERLRITSAGDVGIGTAAPQRDASTTSLAVSGGGSKSASLDLYGTVKNYAIFSGGDGQLGFFNLTDGSERMRIDSAGNVGIGATSVSSSISSSARVLGICDPATTNLASLRLGSGLNFSSGQRMEVFAAAASVGIYGETDAPMVFSTNGSERMRITSAGNVGVGTTSVSGYASNYRQVIVDGGADPSMLQLNNTTTGSGSNTGGLAIVQNGVDAFLINPQATGTTRFFTNNTERMRITSAGNVGIGTSAPLTPLVVSGGVDENFEVFTANVTVNGGGIQYINRNDSSIRPDFNYFLATGGGSHKFYTEATERARIDASGNLLVGTTTSSGMFNGTGGNGFVLEAPSADAASFLCSNLSNTNVHLAKRSGFTNGNFMAFFVTSTLVGTISTNGTATSYNTSSDYRLKEDVQPMVGSVDRLMALKPVNFAWKVDGSRVDGFLAHEAQEVVPEAVTGEKDAVDKDGKPVYQGIDQSKLAPLLVAALQEALQKIEALEARITALEA